MESTGYVIAKGQGPELVGWTAAKKGGVKWGKEHVHVFNDAYAANAAIKRNSRAHPDMREAEVMPVENYDKLLHPGRHPEPEAEDEYLEQDVSTAYHAAEVRLLSAILGGGTPPEVETARETAPAEEFPFGPDVPQFNVPPLTLDLAEQQVRTWMQQYMDYRKAQDTAQMYDDGNRSYWERKAQTKYVMVMAGQQLMTLLGRPVEWPMDAEI